MNLVNNFLGTQLNSGVQLAIIFGVLLVILLLVVWLVRMVFGNNVSRIAKNRQPRLSVTDAAIVDDKRRLVLVRRDNVEHLILIGGNSDVLIEGNISRVKPVQMPEGQLSGGENIDGTKHMQVKPSERSAKLPPKQFGMVAGGKGKGSKISNTGVVGAVAAVASGATMLASKTTANETTNVSPSGGSDKTQSIADAASSVSGDIGTKASNLIKSPITNASTKPAVIEVKDVVAQTVSKTTDKVSSLQGSVETNDDSNIEVDAKLDVVTDKMDKDITITGDVKIDTEDSANLADDNPTTIDNDKSSAELELEKALASNEGDKSFSESGEIGNTVEPNNAGDDDMQKILDELTAEIK